MTSDAWRELIRLENETESLWKRIERAIELAWGYGQIDGAHHKTWVIDQMVRELAGPAYKDFVSEYRGEYDEDYEEFEYEWDEGIPP